ncbi:hypothetical protein DPMN_107625 [Dreissena polymorpha]|uniref:Uncharacterized protein n=1 Tax=Dreissena polymorpha TaxID=45954 RepID=A0A9D4K7D5_DREPO|nr:hypothetical protein DPMN_107625 [Dreissena polymorpha]
MVAAHEGLPISSGGITRPRKKRVISHYDAGGAPLRDPGSSGMNRDSTGMNRGSIGDDRDEPGKTGAPPGKTGNDRRGTGNNRDSTTPTELRQRSAESTVNKKTGALPERHRHSPGLRRGFTGDDRGKIGALPLGECRRCYGIPGLCRLSPGLNRGTTGDNRGYAGTLPAFTGALPATTGALPALHRDKP